jgi:hypothetical protein
VSQSQSAQECPDIHHRSISSLNILPELIVTNIVNFSNEELNIPLNQNNLFIVLGAELSSLP